jgi:FtsH-binding integral membrane protein
LWGAPNEDFIAMSDFNRGVWGQTPAKADMSVDAGLRAFMLGVYNKLALGLALSAVLAWLTSHMPVVQYLFVQDSLGRTTPTALGTALMWAPLAVVLIGSFVARGVTVRNSGAYYWLVVSLLGAGLGVDVLIYTSTSIATAFLVTATGFGVLSLVGYATKRDLSGMGSFLIMALWGFVALSLLNVFFLHLAGLQFVIQLVLLGVFAGLIAYDTQKLKMTYYQVQGDAANMAAATNFGALNLYLDFINIFQILLSLFGGRR